MPEDELPQAVLVGGRLYAVRFGTNPHRRHRRPVYVVHARRTVRVAASKLPPGRRLAALRAAVAAAAVPIVGTVD